MNENTNPIHRVAFGKVTCTDEQLEALRAQALGANLTPVPDPKSVIRRDDGPKSPVVLRSEYESLRQEFIETMQYLANHSQMTENLKDYCNKTLGLLEENDDRIT